MSLVLLICLSEGRLEVSQKELVQSWHKGKTSDATPAGKPLRNDVDTWLRDDSLLMLNKILYHYHDIYTINHSSEHFVWYSPTFSLLFMSLSYAFTPNESDSICFSAPDRTASCVSSLPPRCFPSTNTFGTVLCPVKSNNFKAMLSFAGPSPLLILSSSIILAVIPILLRSCFVCLQ